MAFPDSTWNSDGELSKLIISAEELHVFWNIGSFLRGRSTTDMVKLRSNNFSFAGATWNLFALAIQSTSLDKNLHSLFGINVRERRPSGVVLDCHCEIIFRIHKRIVSMAKCNFKCESTDSYGYGTVENFLLLSELYEYSAQGGYIECSITLNKQSIKEACLRPETTHSRSSSSKEAYTQTQLLQSHGSFYQRGITYEDNEDGPPSTSSFSRLKPIEKSQSVSEKDQKWDNRDHNRYRPFSDDSVFKSEQLRLRIWQKFDKGDDTDWRFNFLSSDKLGSWRNPVDKKHSDVERNPYFSSLNRNVRNSHEHQKNLDEVNQVCQDLKNLLLSEKCSDVTIQVRDQQFKAHRLILTARSTVFAAMFRHDMKEKATGIVNVEDCDPSSFPVLLEFLYSGSTEKLSGENVFGLYTSADKYDIQGLKMKCFEFIKSNLSVDTFCETITLSLQHSEVNLLKIAVDFFTKNFKKIILTTKWQAFILENPIQGNEIFIKALVSDTQDN